MDEVRDEMGIEMNYSNIDYHVTEAEKNKNVIKERFLNHIVLVFL